tara:strand:+ start:269 stop:466 length:198 start_codon:yes stop_codon:yes gene_type:complete
MKMKLFKKGQKVKVFNFTMGGKKITEGIGTIIDENEQTEMVTVNFFNGLPDETFDRGRENIEVIK